MNTNPEFVKMFDFEEKFEEWNDDERETDREPKSEWEHVHTDVYGVDFAISVFKCAAVIGSDGEDEDDDDDKAVDAIIYRCAIVNLRDEGDEIMKELTFWTVSDNELKAMNYTGRYLFLEFEKEEVLTIIDVLNEKFISNDGAGLKGAIVLMRKSREAMAIWSEEEKTMSFCRVPDDAYIGPTHAFEIRLSTLRAVFPGDCEVRIGDYYDEKNAYLEKDYRRATREEKKNEDKKKTENDPINELDGMIGLEDVKKKVVEITAYAEMQKKLADAGKDIKNPGYNMAFRGNPGTAKTTVARIVARVLKEKGMLPDGNFLEVGRSDLIAGYTGQTAIKVKKAFEKAKGGVLFIDEAYSLVDDHHHGYGDEAIATIVQEMENRRGEIAVIFAGYTEAMDKFLSMNPGLRSRIQFNVDFPDYRVDELTEIAKLEAKSHCFEISDAGLKKAAAICEKAMKDDEFGNGRFCRNLVQDAMLRYAVRNLGKEYDCVLDEADFEMPTQTNNKQSGHDRRPIGFAS